jgi:hypothetical protein
MHSQRVIRGPETPPDNKTLTMRLRIVNCRIENFRGVEGSR